MNSPMFSSLRSRPAPMGPKQIDSPDDLDEDEIDLRKGCSTLWRGKWIIAIATLIGGILAYLIVSQQVPEYKASAKVMFGIQQTNVINLQDVLTEQTVESGRLEDQIQILSSTSLMERVIDALNLGRRPEFNPTLRPPVPTLGERIGAFIPIPPEATDFLRSTGIIRPEPTEPLPEDVARRERLAVIQNVQEGLRLRPIGKSRVLEITYLSPSPTLATSIANTIAEQYIVDQLEAKLDATRSATDWLSTRVDDLRVQLQEDEEALEAARASVAENAGQTLEVTQQQLSALNASLSEQRSQVTRLQSLFDRLDGAVESGNDLGAVSEFRASAVIQNFRAQRTLVRNELANLPDSLPEDHPVRVGLREQTAQIDADILQEARNIIQAARSDLTAAIAAQNRAQSLEAARIATAEAQARENLGRFLDYGSGYEPTTVRMFR